MLLSPTSDNSIGISSFTLMPSPTTSNTLYLHHDLPISSSKLYLLLHSRHSSSASFSISRIYRDLTENIINSYPTKGNPLCKLAPEALQEEQDLNSNSAVTLRILSHRFLPFILLVLQGEREEPSPSSVLHVNHSWNKSLLIEFYTEEVNPCSA